MKTKSKTSACNTATSSIHNRFPTKAPHTQSERKQTRPQAEIKNHGLVATALAGLLLFVAMAAPALAVNAVWDTNPSSSFWNDDFNWTPPTAPVYSGDTATFNFSTVTHLSLSSGVTINSVTFNPGASAFSIETSGNSFSFGGVGIINNSGVTQGIVNKAGGTTSFFHSSTAGNASLWASGGADCCPFPIDSGSISFFDTSTAGNAGLVAGGGANAGGGSISFSGNSTASNCTLIAYGAGFGAGGPGGEGGNISFSGNATAGNATLTARAGDVGSGTISFSDNSNAGNATLSVEGAGGGSTGFVPAVISFSGNSTAGNATITSEPGFDFSGGITQFSENSSAGNATLMAQDGVRTPGGIISFVGQSTGGTASVRVFGNGELDITHSVTLGSLIITSNLTGRINLNFSGLPGVIRSLVVNGVAQPSGVYGSPTSGAEHQLPQFAGPGTVEVGPISTLGNISTRAFVQTGDNVMIGGFIVQGPATKRVIIRAIGPELTRYGVPNPLFNPTLKLHDGTGALIASNNNWATTIIGGIITANQVHEIQASGYAPGDGFESAIIADLPPGNYTAIVRGVNNTTGVGLVEVYDLGSDASSILGNISTRSFVQTGDNVMIGGFIVEGNGPKRVIIRAIGPELTQHGVPNPLADPTLELHNGPGALIASNNNWMTTIIGGVITSDQVHDIMDSGRAPTDPSESAIIATLQPGRYTAIVRGVNGTTGIGLVEMYDLD